MAKDSIQKHSLIATVAIFGSRIFGLIREQVFAFFFGASFVKDAFDVAFRIPNLMRDLFAEGALSQAFVTVFSQKLKAGDKDSYDLANRISTFVLLVVGGLVLLGFVFAPQIVSVLGAGFSQEKAELTVRLTRILFPFILFASLGAIFMGMLNAKNKFLLPQSASTFFNITSMTVGLTAAYFSAPEFIKGVINGQPLEDISGLITAITAMAFGTLFGGFVQWFVQYPSLKKLGYRFKLNFNLKNAELIKVLKLTGPAILGGAAVQVNVLVNTIFAGFLGDGAIAYLSYSFRFMQFPLGVFGVAIAIASAPKLAKLVDRGQEGEFLQNIHSSMRLSMFLSIPSMLGLIILAHPIIRVIYEHGQFQAWDTHQTAIALMAYSLGISTYSLIKIYQPAFLAFHDAKTPMYISLFSILTNASINWYFIQVLNLSHWALALGVSCVALLNLVLLGLFFRKKMKGLWTLEIWFTLFKVIIASLAMACAVIYTQTFIEPYFQIDSFANQLGELFIPMFAGVLVYFLFGFLLKIQEAQFFLKMLRQKASR